MKTTTIFCCAALMVSSLASAQRMVNIQRTGRHGVVNARVNANLARGLKADLQKMQRLGVESYLNLWQKGARASRTSLPMGSGAIMVTRVKNGTQAYQNWVREYAPNTIGFMSTGNAQYPGGTGNLRIGDKFFSYSAVRGEGRIQNMSSFNQEHVESTFKTTPAEMKAFKAFFLARHHGLILKNGRTLLPEFDSHHASNLTIEGCAGASSSAIDAKREGWMKYFGQSINHIRAQGRQLGIPALANADASMVQTLKGFMNRYKIDVNGRPYYPVKQNTAPKSLVRIFGTYGGRITMLNVPTSGTNGRNQFEPNLIKQKWDQTHAAHDQDKGWNGMGGKSGVHVLPDRAVGTAFRNDSRSSSYKNVRLSAQEGVAALDGGGNPPPPPPGRININTASASRLTTLPRIGTVKAGRIVESRPFASVNDLTRVRGIGRSTLQRLSDLVTVD